MQKILVGVLKKYIISLLLKKDIYFNIFYFKYKQLLFFYLLFKK